MFARLKCWGRFAYNDCSDCFETTTNGADLHLEGKVHILLTGMGH